MIVAYCCTNRMSKFCNSNMMTSDWGRFKGPPSASKWTFGNAGRSNAVTQCKPEVEAERYVCVRNIKMKLGQDEGCP